VNERPDGSHLIEWGVAARAFMAQDESGDRHLVKPFQNGILVVVVDGLGHGPKAAIAAKAAISALENRAREPVTSLLQHCHRALRGTRGAVVSLASFNVLAGTMTWAGVGNVNGLLVRANAKSDRPQETLLPRGGVVGYQLPSLYPETIQVAHGDMLILATDGIRSRFTQDLMLDGPAQQVADYILTHHSRGTDDALVLAARYTG